MKLVSWNVNGLRAVVKKGFSETFDTIGADVFALQETKLQEGDIDLELPGYHSYWSYAQRKGYSGTAVYTRNEPIQVIHKLGIDDLDTEGRVCALEFPGFWFVDVYTPNSQQGLARISHRMEWDDAFRDFCVGLHEGSTLQGPHTAEPKPVIMCGDFNVAHEEIDLKYPKSNRGNAGFSDEERGKFTQLLDAGFTDTFRKLHPDLTGAYSWWSYRFHARQTNAGWRIDYFLCTNDIADKVFSAGIYSEVMGSDHCPVYLDIDIA